MAKALSKGTKCQLRQTTHRLLSSARSMGAADFHYFSSWIEFFNGGQEDNSASRLPLANLR